MICSVLRIHTYCYSVGFCEAVITKPVTFYPCEPRVVNSRRLFPCLIIFLNIITLCNFSSYSLYVISALPNLCASDAHNLMPLSFIGTYSHQCLISGYAQRYTNAYLTELNYFRRLLIIYGRSVAGILQGTSHLGRCRDDVRLSMG